MKTHPRIEKKNALYKVKEPGAADEPSGDYFFEMQGDKNDWILTPFLLSIPVIILLVILIYSL